MRAITITTEAQRKAAIERAHELNGCTNGIRGGCANCKE
jgi:hypothetical protein